MPAAAGPVSWAHQAGVVQSNGAVTVKSLSGSSYSMTANPTASAARSNQNAATQPPTVLVLPNAQLPIKSAGDSCASETSGTSPSQTANEGTAITLDRKMLLSCQDGRWGNIKNGSGSLIEPSCPYSTNFPACVPPSCPSGWENFGTYQKGTAYPYAKRYNTCYHAQAYTILQPTCSTGTGYQQCQVPPCPSGFVDLGIYSNYQSIYSSSNGGGFVETNRFCIR